MMSDRFDQLLELAQEAFAGGRLEEAVDHFEAARDWAVEIGDADRADRAACNVCFVRIEMGQAESQIPLLRQLFLRAVDPTNRWSASYTLAVAFDILEDLEEATKWASRSAELSEQIGNREGPIRANNLAGILSLRRSSFVEAEGFFRRALLALSTPENDNEATHRGTILGNLGYALMCTDRLSEGLSLCETARESLEALSADHLLYENLQDLCYGFILDGQLEKAHQAGERAFGIAERYEDLQVMKNCLFLLAEVAVRRGDAFRGRRYLRELAEFYPEIETNEEIIDVFLATDLTNVVNLRG